MRKQDRLSALIQSLNPSEKRYFAQYAALGGNDKGYLKLYESLQGSNTYDADAIAKRLNKRKADLANEKKYLETILLGALTAFHSKHEEVALLKESGVITMLMNRGMHDYALERVVKLKVKATAQSNYAMLGWLCKKESELIYARAPESKEMRQGFVKSAREGKNALTLASILFDFELLALDIAMLQQQKRIVADKTTNKRVERLLQHPLNKAKFKEPILQFSQYVNRSLLYSMLSRHDQAIKYSRMEVALLETRSNVLPADERNYFITVNNLLQNLITGGKYAEAEKLLAAIDGKYYCKLNFDYEKLDALFASDYEKHRLFLLQQRYLARQVNKEAIRHALDEFRHKSKKLETSLLPNSWVVTLMLAAKLHLLIGEPDRSLHWLNMMIHRTEAEMRPPVQATARLAQVLAHQEIGNALILPHLVASARRFFENAELLTRVETVTFQAILRINKLTDAQEQARAFKQLHKTYLRLEKNQFLKSRIAQVNLLQWVERNLEKLRRGRR